MSTHRVSEKRLRRCAGAFHGYDAMLRAIFEAQIGKGSKKL